MSFNYAGFFSTWHQSDKKYNEQEEIMDLQKIEQHLQGQLAHLDELSASPDHIVTFGEYKEIYDTLIALKQAQALERIATQLEDGKIAILEGEDIVERLSRIGSILMDK